MSWTALLLFVLVTALLALLVSLVWWAGSDVPEDDQVSRSGVASASETDASAADGSFGWRGSVE